MWRDYHTMPETESQPNGLLVPEKGVTLLEGHSIESSAGLLQERRSGGVQGLLVTGSSACAYKYIYTWLTDFGSCHWWLPKCVHRGSCHWPMD